MDQAQVRFLLTSCEWFKSQWFQLRSGSCSPPPQVRLTERGQVTAHSPKGSWPHRKGGVQRVRPTQGKSPLPPPGLALHAQVWGTHLVMCYKEQHFMHEVDCKVCNLTEQSSASGEEMKLINCDEVGSAGKREQWEEGRRWWSSLKSGD